MATMFLLCIGMGTNSVVFPYSSGSPWRFWSLSFIYFWWRSFWTKWVSSKPRCRPTRERVFSEHRIVFFLDTFAFVIKIVSFFSARCFRLTCFAFLSSSTAKLKKSEKKSELLLFVCKNQTKWFSGDGKESYSSFFLLPLLLDQLSDKRLRLLRRLLRDEGEEKQQWNETVNRIGTSVFRLTFLFGLSVIIDVMTDVDLTSKQSHSDRIEPVLNDG